MSSLGHILVIDDEPNLRQTLTRLLRKADCEVTSAENGAEALRYLRADSFDLVYLDIRLPDMDGLQVLKAIRQVDARPPGAAPTPVILLTAFGSLQTALEAMRLGATDYLLKPVDPEVLLTRTRQLLNSQALERRRQALQAEIERLQAELRALDSEAAPTPAELFSAYDEGRFLKRGNLVLDLQARHAICAETIITLPPTSFDYLVILARHAPEVVDYQTLVAEAQGFQAQPRAAGELTKYHIHIIRQGLEREAACKVRVLNVRSDGYRLLVD